MKFRNNLPAVEEVKNTDIVDYLATLGFKPSKISRNDYWFISPFRDEKKASFKVNRSLNRWYDFGKGKGGNLIDFGIRFHQCSVKDFLEKMKSSFSFQQPATCIKKEEDDDSRKIKIISEKEIISLVLLRYLHKRRIPADLARKYCRQVDYELYGKTYYAIGFKNSAGGFELRNEKFKASSSPKDVTWIQNDAQKLTVFEGFFNFLSYQAIHQNQEQPTTSFLILNSASFFQKNLPLTETYRSVLYLDCDTTGQKCIQKALDTDSRKFIDESHLYKNYKDLNDWMMHIGQSQKQSAYLKP